ncbi:Peptide chain release factor N(5)-glutamine methyltransferase [hydrothermal vent metagenome]|uniref:peptide chain release factor N(5)-glutamine methyltransferase n=1 Tax=hydrothermal vent metagenome TaxID=652676 RepID=A0A3B0Z3G8_9ZZZZ
MQLVLWACTELTPFAAEQARFEAELLLAFALDKPRVYLHSWPEATPDKETQSLYQQLIHKRLSGTPIAYLTGQREFWSLALQVNPHTLIPRPETETLVEKVLQQIRHIQSPQVIDLGTGSGAIALAIASERPDAQVTASDSSHAALKVARHNAQHLKLNNITFMQTNWCQNLPLNHYHLIVTNPPYIASDDHHLNEGDVRFEPVSALSSGIEGLDDIRVICQNAGKHLLTGGWLSLEHGFDQAEAVRTILGQENFSHLGHACDLAQIPRISWGQKVST